MYQGICESSNRAISVSALNRSARDLLEHGLPLMWVVGEISNLSLAGSGHCYFSLKDEFAQVRCVMFRHRYQTLDWVPKNGEQVEVRAVVTLYEPRGDFQLGVENMRVAGLGALYEAFQKLKAKLEAEGLFELSIKKPLPSFSRCLGVITSTAAAALRDVLTTLKRRMPSINVIVYPTPVQGAGAGKKIANAINMAARRAECDALILCRGGGSIEDLWAFNEEIVARAIYACAIPIVSGVGHETDFTIADFVADARAPTPTAAAEMLSPDCAELRTSLSRLSLHLKQNLTHMLERRMQHTDYLAKRLLHPGERLRGQTVHLAQFYARFRHAWQRLVENQRWAIREQAQQLLQSKPDIHLFAERGRQREQQLRHSMDGKLERHDTRLKQAQIKLETLNPQSVLERGYSIACMTDGKVVRDAKQIAVGEVLHLRFAIGGADANITKTTIN